MIAFVARYLTSVEHLEVFMLLQRDPVRSWSGAEVADELNIPNATPNDVLEQLSRRPISDRHDGRLVEGVPHASAYTRVDEGPSTNGVDHHRRLDARGETHLLQVHVGVAIVENAASTEDEQVEGFREFSCASRRGVVWSSPPRTAGDSERQWRRRRSRLPYSSFAYQPTIQTAWETLKLLANGLEPKGGEEGVKWNQAQLRRIDLE